MSAIEGQTVIVQTSPRTIGMGMQGRQAVIVSARIMSDDRGEPALAASVLIGSPGTTQVVRTLWEGEFYVQTPAVAPAVAQASTPTTPPTVAK